VERRPLGRGGPDVPVLFLGTWPLGGGMGPVPRTIALATIRHALTLGVSALDTAEGYGDAEELIGAAIPPAERDAVFLATKVSFGPYTVERVRRAAEQSLRRMRTDRVDLLQLHFYPADIDPDEALDALLGVRDAGLAREVGLSNLSAGQLERAVVGREPPRALQVPLNLFDRDELQGSIRRCRELGIGVLCHSALAKGLLAGSLTGSSAFAADDERSRHPRFAPDALAAYLDVATRLAALADEASLGIVELAVAWVLAQDGVTACIAGPRNPDELEAQLRGARAVLPPGLTERAAAIAAKAPGIGHGTPTSSPSPPSGA
jgi:aryl-alcohol dehydrogenase-like predicted oxidoreductase